LAALLPTAKRERPEREITILLLSFVICFFCPLYSMMAGEEGDAEGGKGEWLSCCVVLAENQRKTAVAGKPGGSCCDGGSAAVLLLCYVFLPLYVSVLMLLSLQLLLLRSLTMVELLSLAVLLGTKQNDGGVASNGGGRETREREMSYCSSPLFFCFFFPSILLSVQVFPSPFVSQTIPCFLLSIRFSSSSSFPTNFAPLVSFFSFPPLSHSSSIPSPKYCPPVFGFLPSGFYRQAKRESPLPCSIMHGTGGNRVTLPLQGKVADCLQGMVPLSWQGIVVWVWVLAGFYASGRERK
jgi:hypothetical protein